MIDRRLVEHWIAWLRVAGVVFAVIEVGAFSPGRPSGYEAPQWALTGAFAAGALVLLYASRNVGDAQLEPVGFAALVFDTAVIGAYAFMYAYEYGNQTRWALILVVVEGALRFGLAGGIVIPIALIPYFAINEWWRAHEWGPPGFITDRVTFPAGITLLTGVIVGWLVQRLRTAADFNVDRASEAERLRDELGRRVDVLEAANRCARALGSSLEIDEAFGAFIRELRGLVSFERTAIVLVEGETAQTMATAGRGAGTVFPPGTVGPLRGSVLERVLEGELVVRRDLAEPEFPADGQLLELGLRSELVAPLMLGARPIGMISVARAEVDAFSAGEAELVALLGRLVATAVQNIRAYEAERRTAAELRRLSALRADFVSLVSHELRSPMAAVIGAARTLQDRWRTLTVDQRDAFLALIADETNRLAALIGDVLDTSRIEAGTFSYTFTDVDLARLVTDAVATASVGQDEVRVHAEVGQLPLVRGDRERLRQVITNLIDNAIKYSPAGDEVRVTAAPENGTIRITVVDHGPGIPQDQQRLIFEKFGRAEVPGGSKPGTGLGLFIARSIAEAHGGTVDVRSRPREGATFVLTLPVTRS
jgi:signal transduction histidine kinase